MRIGEATVPASPELVAASAASVASARSMNPAELAAQIEAQNTPSNLRKLARRLTRAFASRREAERLYFEEWFAKG